MPKFSAAQNQNFLTLFIFQSARSNNHGPVSVSGTHAPVGGDATQQTITNLSQPHPFLSCGSRAVQRPSWPYIACNTPSPKTTMKKCNTPAKRILEYSASPGRAIRPNQRCHTRLCGDEDHMRADPVAARLRSRGERRSIGNVSRLDCSHLGGEHPWLA